jgi:hypothetical protein
MVSTSFIGSPSGLLISGMEKTDCSMTQAVDHGSGPCLISIRWNTPASCNTGASESFRWHKRSFMERGDLSGPLPLSLVMVSLNPVEKKPVFRQHRLNNSPLPHGQGSLRPSFSFSSLSQWTNLRPRLTLVSLRVASTPLGHGFKRRSRLR